MQTAFLQEDIVMQTDSHSYDFFSWELNRLAVNSAETARPDFTRPFFYKVLPLSNSAQEVNQIRGPPCPAATPQVIPSTGSPWVSLWGHRRWPGQGSTLMNTLNQTLLCYVWKFMPWFGKGKQYCQYYQYYQVHNSILTATWSLMLLLHNLHRQTMQSSGEISEKKTLIITDFQGRAFFCPRQEAWDSASASQEQPAANVVPREAKTSPATSYFNAVYESQ